MIGSLAPDPHGEQLSPREVDDLLAALDDEYKARATYRQVLDDFGDVRPFSNIVDAEQRHIDALVALFERYGVDVPPDPWEGQAPQYTSLHQACVAGVEAEIENAALYDRVLAGTTRDDVLFTYRNLQRASQENHLPAFQRGVARREDGSSGRGRSPGRDDGGGHGGIPGGACRHRGDQGGGRGRGRGGSI